MSKPPGLVVHPGVGNWTGTLANALAFHFGKELPVLEGNSHNRIGLVHRIDKDTSGLMVVAKSDLAMTHLAKQFFDHTIERTYYALVWGDLEQDKGTISNYVGRDDRNPRVNRVYEEGEDGKLAVTHYEVIERMYYTTLVKCNLETGRTHQIRVHMQHLGHPLFSDRHYGGDKIVKGTVYSKYKQYVEKIFTAMPVFIIISTLVLLITTTERLKNPKVDCSLHSIFILFTNNLYFYCNQVQAPPGCT